MRLSALPCAQLCGAAWTSVADPDYMTEHPLGHGAGATGESGQGAGVGYVTQILEVLALVFVFLLGTMVLGVLLFYVIDRTQPGDAIRRNYPVIGRFRGLFTKLGEFFRQYFFAMDREEMPFNRAQRDWVAHATKGKGNTIAFGSTRNISVPGTAIFVNAAFPPLDDKHARTRPLVIGLGARQPYAAPSFFNISGMSFGAISRPAVQALSRGA